MRLICLGAAALLAASAGTASAQSSRVELDHVYIVVQPGAEAEVAALRTAGFSVSREAMRHEGQGTASLAVVFQNMYLELLWVDSTVAVAADQSVDDYRRAEAWRATGASPFGVGLRKNADTVTLAAPAQRHYAEWMQQGTAIEIFTQPQEMDAFKLFVVPSYMALPAWIADVKERFPELLAHANGAARVTNVEVHGAARHRPSAVTMLPIPSFRFVESEAPLVTIEVDGGTRQTIVDFRPALPLLLRQ